MIKLQEQIAITNPFRFWQSLTEKKIAEILKVSPGYLMGWENEEKIADNLYSVS